MNLYDDLGRGYSRQRQTDPRIGAAIEAAVAGCGSVLNVGAGTGSYEPRSPTIVAVEPSRCAKFWLFDYVPELLRVDRELFPPMSTFAKTFDIVDVVDVPIPGDCQDGFLGAYWQRPSAYLNPAIRESISTFSKIGNVSSQLQRLRTDIDSGAWDQRYSALRGLNTLDLGYRLIIAGKKG